ncbi:MAG: DUF1934 domain-containing protein [Roseburia sp.]|nr:DUF1934 domain-containing protein [Roseburia sp.]MCM1279507.1 DUF1934 domain-containing protein [Robinsoniella sp.]
MTKEVLVSVAGLQYQNGETDRTETITVGNYYKKADSHYLFYEEMIEGFSEPVKNRITFSKGQLSVQKNGVVTSNMIFEEKKKNLSNYVTPYGNIMVGIDAKKVELKEEEQQIKVQVDYAMEINYEHLADCSLTINIKEKREGISFSL